MPAHATFVARSRSAQGMMSHAHWLRYVLSTCVLLIASVSRIAQAQNPRDLASIAVRVLDSNERPLADAEVFVVQLDMRLRTSADGLALLVGVAPGSYDVGVRRVGYLPRSAKVSTTTGGSSPTAYTVIALVAYTTRLTPVLTTARRSGLSGFVSDTALTPLPNARIQVAGSGRSTRTDSAGTFFMPLRAGTYLLRVERDSFASQTVGVTVPKDSGRQVAVWLVPQPKRDRAVYAVEWARQFELDRRMIRAHPTSSRFYTRDQLLGLGITDMARLARQWATGGITALCLVSVNETAHANGYTVPLSSVVTDEVEFVEVYFGGRRPTRPSVWGDGMTPGGPNCGMVAIAVWLRR